MGVDVVCYQRMACHDLQRKTDKDVGDLEPKKTRSRVRRYPAEERNDETIENDNWLTAEQIVTVAAY